MLSNILAEFYERDIRKLIEEVNLFNNEEDLWRTQGNVKNSCGNLVLHIIGGLNHFVGTTLAQTMFAIAMRSLVKKVWKEKNLLRNLKHSFH